MARRLHISSAALLAAICVFGSIGCQGLTPGKTEWVQTSSTTPRAGNVYLLRGLIGVFSTGMDSLAKQLNESGVAAHVFQDDQRWTLAKAISDKYKGVKDPEPLVLIGHSYGADDVVRVARELEKDNITIDLMITFDCTVPPDVPKNVKLCYNYYQSQPTDFIPLFRGIPLKQDTGATGKLVNIDLRKDRTDLLEPGTNHINIDKNPKLHDAVLAQVLATCVPQAQWTTTHGKPTPAAPTAVAPKAAPSSGAKQVNNTNSDRGS